MNNPELLDGLVKPGEGIDFDEVAEGAVSDASSVDTEKIEDIKKEAAKERKTTNSLTQQLKDVRQDIGVLKRADTAMRKTDTALKEIDATYKKQIAALEERLDKLENGK